MGIISLTTHEIKRNIDLLNEEQRYFYSKKAIYTRSSFGASGLLSSYLLKIMVFD